MVSKADYANLIARLKEVECEYGPHAHLTDECVDRENVLIGGRTENDSDFWSLMYDAALSAAQFRAEEAGIDLSL